LLSLHPGYEIYKILTCLEQEDMNARRDRFGGDGCQLERARAGMHPARMGQVRVVPERRIAHRHVDPEAEDTGGGHPGPDICVVNEEEIGGYTFARFARNGTPWPNPDWYANVDDFCFYMK